jgi:hypothetical protein
MVLEWSLIALAIALVVCGTITCMLVWVDRAWWVLAWQGKAGLQAMIAQIRISGTAAIAHVHFPTNQCVSMWIYIFFFTLLLIRMRIHWHR